MLAATRILLLVLGLSLTHVGIYAQMPPTASGAKTQATVESQLGAEPEIGYVRTDKTLVYAGPSEEHYPTAALERGAVVEIVHRTDDGWLAIRPPSGSFSWLPASDGFLLSGGRVVEVTESNAVCWIGSALGTPKQYRWQVRVKRGEHLAVVGEKKSSPESESEKKALWYQVTPPTGEYRWIQSQVVGSQPPREVSPVVQASATARPNRPSASSSARGQATGGDVQLAAGQSNVSDDQSTSGTEDAEVISTDKPRASGKSKQVAASRNAKHKSRDRQVTDNGADSENADPWNTWHAVEMNGGSLSFPGLARMFGMEPVSPSAAAVAYDPFDLTAAPTRSRSAMNATQATDPAWVDPYAVSPMNVEQLKNAPTLATNGSRGWRDPRQLRERRQSSVLDTVHSAGGDIMLAGAESEEIGTGVVLASASSPTWRSNSNSASDNWYAIRQAPPYDSLASGSLAQADLNELQLRLSEMVAGPEQSWNLGPLAERTRFLIEHGETALERGQARLLLERIEAFSNVAQRSQQLGLSQSPGTVSSQTAAVGGSPLVTTASRLASPLGIGSFGDDISSGNAPRFDATGWIVPVHSSGQNMPTHALTNDTGKIIVYLSPAAGVNLSRYQGQAVGIYGLRGYLPHLKSNHIQVQRAVRLQ